MDAAQALGQLQPKETVVLKAGTIVKVGGFPFKLLTDTQVEGHHTNLQLSLTGQQAVQQGGFIGIR